MKRWESDKYKSWGLPPEGFRDYVLADGSLLGVAENGVREGWSVEQLD